MALSASLPQINLCVQGETRGSPHSHREDHHIVRNAPVQPSASSAAILAQVEPSVGVPVSSRIIRRRLAEGHLGSRTTMVFSMTVW
ncbi:hypothetical protein TNCV_4387681 [Trichonephila clavipes]|nr:hypothetical protein TNCV_4387681 [Trichonephila clavipes]